MTTESTTFKIIIFRLDKSEHRYADRRVQRPRRGDILETVVDGKLVKAEVERVRLNVGSSEIWTVQAIEI